MSIKFQREWLFAFVHEGQFKNACPDTGHIHLCSIELTTKTSIEMVPTDVVQLYSDSFENLMKLIIEEFKEYGIIEIKLKMDGFDEKIVWTAE